MNNLSFIKNKKRIITFLILTLTSLSLISLLSSIQKSSTRVLDSIKSSLTYNFDVKSSTYNLDKTLTDVETKTRVFADTSKDLFSFKYANNAQALNNYLNSLATFETHSVLNTEWAQGIWIQLDESIASSSYYFSDWYRYKDGKLIKEGRTFRKLTPKTDPYYFNALKAQKPIWTDVYIDTDINIPMITYSVPIYKNGKLIGCVGMDLSTDEITKILINLQSQYNGSEIFLINSHNSIIATSIEDKKCIGRDLFNYKRSLDFLKDKILYRPQIGYFDYKGTDRMVFFSRLTNDNYIIITIPTSVIYKEFHRLIILCYIMFAILTFLVFYTLRDKYQFELQNKKLKELNEVAEESTKVKSEFLANMSHEIRTPMNEIAGYVQLLATTDLSVEQRDFVGETKKSLDSLLNLINNILDFSKLESSKVVLENINFDLHSLIDEVISLVAPNAHKKKLEVNAFVNSNVPQMVYGDPARLKQVFNNLLGNSIKFTEKGEVLLTAKIVSDNHDYADILFEVIDSGIGIPKSSQQKLFSAFIQADSSTTKKYGGTGLGLSIADTIIKLMGSTIKLESKEGEGAKFSFVLRFQKDLTAEQPAKIDNSIGGKRILIVDNNRSNIDIIKHYLEQENCIVHDATTLKDAVNFIETNKELDLFILDLNLSEKDVFYLVSVIKNDKTFKNTPLLLITSVFEIFNDSLLREKGFSGYLTKPIKKQNLSEIISLIFTSSGEIVHNSQPELNEKHVLTQNNFHSKYTVLLAEDFEGNRKLLDIIFKKANLNCDMVENGIKAVETYKNNDYDLILMDCQMPEMDGFEATMEIRKIEHEINEKTGSNHHIPVIALTAHAHKDIIEKCKNAGMDDYLCKPIEMEKMFKLMKLYLKGSSSMPDTKILHKNVETHEHKKQNVDEIIAEIIETLSFSKEDALELFEKYMEFLTESLDTLETSLKNGDFTTIKEIAHTFKGSSVKIGMLKDLFERLEKASLSSNVGLCNSLIQEINDYYNYLKS